MRECHVLAPELFALVAPLRALLATMLRPKRTAEVQLTLVDQGVDVALSGVEAEGLEAAEALTDFCEANSLARLTIDEGWAPNPIRAGSGDGNACRASPWHSRPALSSRRHATARRRWSRECARRVGGSGSGRRPVRRARHLRAGARGRGYAAEAARDAVLALKGAALAGA